MDLSKSIQFEYFRARVKCSKKMLAIFVVIISQQFADEFKGFWNFCSLSRLYVATETP